MTEEEEEQNKIEHIKIGEIELSSTSYDVGQLGSIVLTLLKDPDIKEYLQIKKNGDIIKGVGYTG